MNQKLDQALQELQAAIGAAATNSDSASSRQIISRIQTAQRLIKEAQEK